MTYRSTSAVETQKIAADFAQTLKGGELVSLIGELGTGKTTFTRGLVEALGGTVRVKSPTFTVMNEYPVTDKKIRRVVHIDLYRFNDITELGALSLEDERLADTVILVEWPEKIPDLMQQADIRVHVSYAGQDVREISII